MHKYIFLSLSLIACQEVPTDVVSDDHPSDVSAEENTGAQFGVERYPNPTDSIQALERTDDTLDAYIIEKVKEITSTNEELSLTELPPAEISVDADCTYGGELEGEITLGLDNLPKITLDFFDDSEIHLYELEEVIQPLADATDPSPTHIISKNTLEMILHSEFIDIEPAAGFQHPMAKVDDPVQAPDILDNALELTIHKEYVDIEIEGSFEVPGLGRFQGEWFICQ